MDTKWFRHVVEFCTALRRTAPNCFHRLYESDIHCIYDWATKPTCCVLDAIETCGNETCKCNKLREIAERLAPR